MKVLFSVDVVDDMVDWLKTGAGRSEERQLQEEKDARESLKKWENMRDERLRKTRKWFF